MKTLIRNAFRIYKKDIGKISRNWVSLVILSGLVLLPSLYAWINIYASWDPYGNTSGVKVGIVNKDKGTVLKGTNINIGEEVTALLKDNKKLGWTFFKEEKDALDSVDKGDVYAVIMMPKDFSEKMATLLENNPTKPELEYYVNEKINAIAPKMTESGANTLQKEITTSFVQAVSDRVFEALKEAGVELDKDYPDIERLETTVYALNRYFPEVEKGIDYLLTLSKGGKIIIDKQDSRITALQDVMSKIIGFNKELSELLNKLQINTEDTVSNVKDEVAQLQNLCSNIENSVNRLNEKIKLNKPVVIKDIDQGITKLNNIKDRLKTLSEQATTLDQKTGEEISAQVNKMNSTINEYIKVLETIKNRLNKGDEIIEMLSKVEALNTRLMSQLEDLKNSIQNVYEVIDNKLARVQEIVDKIGRISEQNAGIAIPLDKINALTGLIGEAQRGLGESKFQNISMILEDMASQLNHYNDQVPQRINELNRELSKAIQDLRNATQLKVQGMENQITTIQEAVGETKNIAQGIKTDLTTISSESKTAVNKAIKDLKTLQQHLKRVEEEITKLSHNNTLALTQNIKKINEDIGDLQNKLGTLQNKIQNTTETEQLLERIGSRMNSLEGRLDNINTQLDAGVVSKIKEELIGATDFIRDINNFLKTLNSDLQAIKDFSDKLATKGEVLSSDVEALQKKLPGMHKMLGKAVDKFNMLNNTFDIKDLINKVTMDNSSKSDFLASPVILNTHRLYPMANYGAGMTPFYTTLCLWVGALLLTALLTTNAKNADFEYTPVQEYLGKYFLFGTLACMQGLIAAVGDLKVLGVQVKEPVLFVILAMFYSIIFSGIIYTLVALFGNVGKAIGVVLLVLQLAGSGGTFPIQVTPIVFQNISKFLPFTYAIGGMREAVSGVYYDNLVKDIGMLIMFFILFLALGFLLKRKANAFLHKFAKKLGESGIIEH